MLIEFKVANFRSFRKCQTLSMVGASLQEHTEANTFDPNLRGGFERLLRATAVYGPNASGKTNLLRALQTMQAFVTQSAASPKNTPPPYMPFKLAGPALGEPSQFEATFVQEGIRYEYGFDIDARRVTKEWLIEYVNPRGRAIFERTYNKSESKYQWKFSSFLKGQRTSWSESTRDESLFLSTAVQLNSKQLLPAFEWFQKKLVVIVGPISLNNSLTLQMVQQMDGKERILPFLKEADLGIVDFKVTREPLILGTGPITMPAPVLIEQTPGDLVPAVVRVTFSHQSEGEGGLVELDYSEESSGTQLFFMRAGAWLNVISKGEVLLVDEIDTSLHPLLTRFLIKRFQTSSINSNNAQIVFTTHNTSLLHSELFRRDQIWFVEKEAGGGSRLYPLTDFHPRNSEAIERGYLQGRYGALPILDEPGFLSP